MRHAAKLALSIAAALLATGCGGVQSALDPQGPDAERAFFLLIVMTIGGGVIFALVLFLSGVALLAPRRARRWMTGDAIIIWLGIVFPVVTLSVLVVYGFIATEAGGVRAPGAPVIRIAVEGRRWWWRVVYRDEQGRPIVSANELHLPLGQPVEIEVTSADVIHSFWIPGLAGKLDMIPGKVNLLTLTARRSGVMRGQCAEYCGGAHALMSFNVVVVTPDEFRDWLRREAAPAREPADALAKQGKTLFFASGCNACHAIRGSPAVGQIGPDLTHVGGRSSIGAATLKTTRNDFARWIMDNQRIKPGNEMPSYGIFDAHQLDALADWLAGLR